MSLFVPRKPAILRIWDEEALEYSLGGGGLISAPPAGFTSSCTPSSDFIARLSGAATNTDKTNYDALICGLNSDGVLSKADALWITGGAPSSTDAKLNLVSTSFSLTEIGTPGASWSQTTGFTGDGSTYALNTGFVLNAGGTNFSLHNASFGVYLKNTRNSGSAFDMGTVVAASNFIDMPVPNYAINNFTITGVSATTVNGFWLNNLVSDVATTYNFSTNNSNNGLVSSGQSGSAVLDTVSMYILAANNGGVGAPAADQALAAFIGGALTGTDITNLKTRLNTFMTAYGINQY